MSGLYCVTSCKAKLSLGVWNFLKVKCLHTCHKWLPSFSPTVLHTQDRLLTTHLTSLYQLQNTRCFPAAKSCFSEPSGLRKQITYLSKIMLSKSCCLLLIYQPADIVSRVMPGCVVGASDSCSAALCPSMIIILTDVC